MKPTCVLIPKWCVPLGVGIQICMCVHTYADIHTCIHHKCIRTRACVHGPGKNSSGNDLHDTCMRTNIHEAYRTHMCTVCFMNICTHACIVQIISRAIFPWSVHACPCAYAFMVYACMYVCVCMYAHAYLDTNTKWDTSFWDQDTGWFHILVDSTKTNDTHNHNKHREWPTHIPSYTCTLHIHYLRVISILALIACWFCIAMRVVNTRIPSYTCTRIHAMYTYTDNLRVRIHIRLDCMLILHHDACHRQKWGRVPQQIAWLLAVGM